MTVYFLIVFGHIILKEGVGVVLRQQNFRQNFTRKFHAKISRNFWHKSLNLFEETFSLKFRQNFTQNFAKISHNLHKIEHTKVKIALSPRNSKYPMVLSQFRQKVNLAQCSIYNFSRFFLGVGRRGR